MHLVLLLLFFFSFDLSFAGAPDQKVPTTVRIRMERDLTTFPQIKSARPKKLGPGIWQLQSDSDLVWRGKTLPARTFVLKKKDKKFDIISSVDFNDYVAGVVANEVPVTWPREALRAQAVVARSYTLARIHERAQEWYHLESNHEDQMFQVTHNRDVQAAVRDTDGVVLRRKNGLVLKAFYHADCGGRTVSAKHVWGEAAYDAGTAKDPWCANRKSNRWSYELDRQDFYRQIGTVEAAQFQVSRFVDRAQSLLIGQKVLSTQKLRELLGYFKVRSAVDRIEVTPKRVRLSGRGFGHGAGLCQWGTLEQAKAGRNYLQILKHYYPLVQISERKPLRRAFMRGSWQKQNTHLVSQSE